MANIFKLKLKTQEIQTLIRQIREQYSEKNLNDNVVNLFIQKVLEKIALTSFELLDQRTNGYYSSGIRENYKITVKNGKGTLLYYDKAVAFAEFGVGQIGELETDNEIKKLAESFGWRYNVGDKIIRRDGALDYWVFKLNGRYITFSGYKGKGFIYDACNVVCQASSLNSIYEEVLANI